MAAILEWIKNYSMVVLLLTVLTSSAAKKEYRKYIQLFVEIVWVITLINPLLLATQKSGDLFEKISYDSFWQGLTNIKMDREKIDFLDESYYIDYYEKAIEEDIKLLANNSGYEVRGTVVSLNEAFEVEELKLHVAKREKESIVAGTEEMRREGESLMELRDKIAAYYQIGPDQITVTD